MVGQICLGRAEKESGRGSVVVKTSSETSPSVCRETFVRETDTVDGSGGRE